MRFVLNAFEIAALSLLILAARCANYQNVFVAGAVYFTDGDCYARMTRARMCAEHPGLIVRHHGFENFPAGVTPHTTAPLDYLIVGLSVLLRPFTAYALDLAGALVSPLLALLCGWFLWWWSRRMKFRYRWALLVLYAVSPVLVHATKLGRPDHQSLTLVLVIVAICIEWLRQRKHGVGGTGNDIRESRMALLAASGGAAWAMAIWVSAYEPLILLIILLGCRGITGQMVGSVFFHRHRSQINHRQQQFWWLTFAGVIAVAFLIEQRVPRVQPLYSGELFRNWSRTIFELISLSPVDPLWLRWGGWLLVAAPALFWFAFRSKSLPPLFVCVSLAATYLLTIWQARWGYFFLALFAIALPALLEPIRSRTLVWTVFTVSLFPLFRQWDEQLWPNDSVLARRMEEGHESVQLRELARVIRSPEVHPFLAPWWLSPSIAYWSGQPGVAGSSHESLDGIAESARFFLTEDAVNGRQILTEREVVWVFAYDSDRVAENSGAILGLSIPSRPLCRILDRTPGQAPPYLILSGQNETAKLFRVKSRP